MKARWRLIGGLTADPRLLQRAEVLVNLRETFVAPGSDRVVRAGLGSPLQAAMTLIRASDDIDEFELTMAPAAEAEPTA